MATSRSRFATGFVDAWVLPSKFAPIVSRRHAAPMSADVPSYRRGTVSGLNFARQERRLKSLLCALVIPLFLVAGCDTTPKTPVDPGPPQPEIGRAVQQECRDRSRMPSSA
eukprot:TRINITY_DN36012_c0_g1_i21.p1 TRINITY_DN36012_c0_g1~~TRINITY_DN36012_c0_g1_i21.p1  ORF type:complete len:111 (+),score=12.71 TRINITY_DN36012_c0_g1_i21:90-422(+)